MSMTRTTFESLFTVAGTTATTVMDSDGKVKWALHNLFLNSATGATQGVTVVSGADYTIKFKGTGSITYSGAASGTLNGTGADDLVSVEVTASTTTLTCTVTGTITEVRVFRSDLGGMQNGSDGTDYLATSGSALFTPGIAYDANGACLGIQPYQARTNSWLRSHAFDNASWTKSEVTVGADATTSPDGTTNAESVTPSTNSTGHYVRQDVTTTAAAWTFSVYAKANGYDFVWISNDGGSTRTWFNLSTGAVGTSQGGVTYAISDAGGGWYRVSITETMTAASNALFVGASNADATSTFAGNGSSGIRLWGAQAEAGSFPSPYIPTFGATATRGAHNTTKAVSEYGHNNTEGTLFATFTIPADPGANATVFQIDDGSENNKLEVYVVTSTGAVMAKSVVGGATQADISVGTYTFGDTSKVAFAYQADGFGASLDGATTVEDTSGSVPTVTTLRLGLSYTGTHLNGPLRFLSEHPSRLANGVLEAQSA
jgi:hypothetical protein